MAAFGSNQSFLVAAYVVTWTVVLAYTLWLARKGARVRAAHRRATEVGR